MENKNYYNENNYLKGIFFAVIFALISFLLTHYIVNWNEDAGMVFIFSETIMIPVGMGIISIYYWQRLLPSNYTLFMLILADFLLAVLGSIVFLGEGVICLFIVSPLIIGFLYLGVFIGKSLFQKDREKIQMSFLALFVFIFTSDLLVPHDEVFEVTDQVTINASPAEIWKYIPSYPRNNTPAEQWLSLAGLPYAVQSVCEGEFAGANRKCIFSNGAIFDEKVTEIIKDSLFTFQVITQPADPEIIGHITVQKGRYQLQKNADGPTTVFGTSWYALHVYPALYYNLWAEKITRDVHKRVLVHIKDLIEKEQGS